MIAVVQDEMARGGYRTLLIADRELAVAEYDEWQTAYADASVRAQGLTSQLTRHCRAHAPGPRLWIVRGAAQLVF